MDIWKLWAQKTGLDIQFCYGDTLSQSQIARDSRRECSFNEIDIIAGSPYSDTRKASLEYLVPLVDLEWHIFSSINISNLQTLQDLTGFIVGGVKSSEAAIQLKQNLPQLEPTFFDGPSELFDAVEAGRLKVFVMEKSTAFHILTQRGLIHGFRWCSTLPLTENKLYAAIPKGKNKSKLADMIRKGMASISIREFMEIEKRWGPSDHFRPQSLVTSLSERAFRGTDSNDSSKKKVFSAVGQKGNRSGRSGGEKIERAFYGTLSLIVLAVVGVGAVLLRNRWVAAGIAAHRRAERRFNAMADHFPGGMFQAVVGPAEYFMLIYVSAGCRKLIVSDSLEVDLSDRSKRLKGTKKTKDVNDAVKMGIHKDDIPQFNHAIQSALLGDGRWRFKGRLKRQDESDEIWIEGRGMILALNGETRGSAMHGLGSLDSGYPSVEMDPEHAVLSGVIMDVSRQNEAAHQLDALEKRCRAFSTLTCDALIMIDKKGKILFWNDAAEALLDLAASYVLGMHLDHLVTLHHHEKTQWWRFLEKELGEKLLREGRDENWGAPEGAFLQHDSVFGNTDSGGKRKDVHGPLILKIATKSTEAFPVSLSGTSFSVGRKKFWLISLQDARSQKEDRQTLKKFAFALSYTKESVIITDKIGRIEYANPAFLERTGYMLNEVKGKSMNIVSSGKQTKAFYKALWQQILSGKVWKGEMVNRRKNGEEFLETVTIIPVGDDENEITHFVAVKKDIGKSRRNEMLLRSQLDELERFNRMTVGREMKMVALKKEVNQLLIALEKKEKYTIVE